MTTNTQQQDIVIVGGGTAGWITANLLAATLADVQVTLVESKDIGIIGVGEGSTPHLKLFFDSIGVSDAEWMPQCNATYKNGIRFKDWSSNQGYKSYFHPFATQLDDVFTVPLFAQNVQARIKGYDVLAHPDSYFLETHLTQQGLGPIADESFPFGVAYGYHFDSALLATFLADKAISRGVTRLYANVTNAELDNEGSIRAIHCDDGTVLQGDLFFDCSGFKSMLLQNTLGVKFKSYTNSLFNDAAVVMPTDITSTYAPETVSTALQHGWAWKIPLTQRYGNGYVYSTNYISSDQAETELRQHLDTLDSDVEARHLKMKIGRVEQHWYKNCVAVGLSQGFIEPLEATAIALSFNTVSQFIQAYKHGGYTDQYQDAFNNDINARFEGILDYITCHYKVNQRLDNDYWRDNADNAHISDRLKQILELWQHSNNFFADMSKHNLGGSYQAKSWACLLAGYGVFPQPATRQLSNQTQYQQDLDRLDDFIKKCGLNFKSHSELLAR